MTLDPFPDEAAQLLERALRHLEHRLAPASNRGWCSPLSVYQTRLLSTCPAQRSLTSSSANSARRRRLCSHRIAHADRFTVGHRRQH
jgi:hypothetical protein